MGRRLDPGRELQSEIGTLVERSTRYVILIHLPNGHDALTVRDQMLPLISTLPAHLRRSLTWDRGTELARHHDITLATDGDLLLRPPLTVVARVERKHEWPAPPVFSEESNLAVHTPADLVAVAAEPNGRPRKTLGWAKPAEAMQRLLSDPSRVATTP